MCFFKKPDVINVTSNGDYLLWDISVSQIKSRKVILNVSEGCQAILYLDGIAHPYYPGSHTLEWKKKAEGHMVSAVGVNLEKTFTLKFGAGSIIFYDREIEETTHVGVWGECEVAVMDAKSSHNTFGNSVKNITVSDVKEKLDLKFKEFINAELSQTLKESDYTTVNASINKLSDSLKEKFSQELHGLGVYVTSCSIPSVNFPQGYNEHRQKIIDQKKRDRRQNIERKKELDFIGKLSEISAATASKDKVEPAEKKPMFCPRCGKENPAGVKYCKFCGIKLD